MRKRKDFTKEKLLIPAIYIDNRPMEDAVIFEKTKMIDIDGVAKNKYTVNTSGQVINDKGVILNPILLNSGYQSYRLVTGKKNPKYKNILAHRLVLSVFNPIDNAEEKMTVNHINMNPLDNSLNNLEWVSQRENNCKKYLSLPNDGTSNYHSRFTYSQLVTIVDLLDNSNLKYSEILKNIGMKVTDNNCDSIGYIKRGLTYKKEVEEIRNSRFND